jgi:hypothetical protein
MNSFIQQHPLVKELEPFVVVTEFNRDGLDLAPFGLNVTREHRIDPTRMESEQFLLLLQTLDGRTFGPEGMPMDRWVFYDCCYMPGAIFGFGRPARSLSAQAREVLSVPDSYRGLVPYSMYIAIPMATEGAWMGHNLASIGPTLPEEGLKGLGTLTKALGLKCFGTETFYGATQWSSRALHIHTKFGPLDLHTAHTPAHSEPRTLTYGFPVTDRALFSALRAPGFEMARPEVDRWIESTDVTAMIELQDRIEAGERFVVPEPPRRDETGIHVPIALTA